MLMLGFQIDLNSKDEFDWAWRAMRSKLWADNVVFIHLSRSPRSGTVSSPTSAARSIKLFASTLIMWLHQYYPLPTKDSPFWALMRRLVILTGR